MTKYRPHIDGLRAIAILFVLFFHGGLKFFPSGFIGVDIFFVISGFLITGIIYNSLQNEQFSFIDFYNRRLWRLQPVFICLIFVTTCLSLIYYLPHDLIQYGRSARKTILFSSNVFFGRLVTDYFSPASNQLALLHTWSLSIEWQCYLLLPLAIYGLHRLFGRPYLGKITGLLTLITFGIALYFSSHDPAKSYYQLSCRIFEFLIGSCVALGNYRFSLNKQFINLISLFAFMALFYIATRSDINQGFPNWYALILCIATALIIAIGEHYPQSVLTRLLAIKPLVFIGLLSYSLYIWHWPLLAFIRYENIKETNWVLLITFCFIFILSYLSWRCIEKPARKLGKVNLGYTFVCLLMLPALIINLSVHYVKKYEGLPQRFQELVTISNQLALYNNKKRSVCLQQKIIEVDSDCLLGQKNPNSKTGFMIGDSFSNHSWGFMDTLARQANLSILAHSTTACLALPGIAQYDWYAKNDIYRECYEQTKRYYKMIKTNHYDFVILGQHWKGYLVDKIINHRNDERSIELTQKRIEKALDKALQIIIASGARPVLLKATAFANDNIYECFYTHIKRHQKYDSAQCSFNLEADESQWINDLFSRMKNKYSQLIIIDPKKVQCPKGHCSADINGIPVFRDPGHLTDYASYQLGKIYLQHYKNPLIA
ncbi:acyltransferase family protein [Legionella fairfieldensis]|uniref:acyltransferase family protein n=1 Tax=Legionella fairfieldensis TaxID=45064 RepID=UPI00048A673A|nr:acyltransferase family protein [Legionella fairfieldensis]